MTALVRAHDLEYLLNVKAIFVEWQTVASYLAWV